MKANKMRKWYKYYICDSKQNNSNDTQESSFEYHEQIMGGYHSTEHYNDKNSFFKYYYNGRYISWHTFISKRINNQNNIFSIASGRAITELKLIDEGHQITCSDLNIPNAAKQSKALFPDLEYIRFNILTDQFKKEYDSIICLSLIYTFDDEELDTFFSQVKTGLKKNSTLLLDSSGATDNLLTYLLHDVLLKYETYMIYLILRLIGRKRFVHKFQSGYRRTSKEIIRMANKHNLVLKRQENYEFLHDLQRSRIILFILKQFPFTKKFFTKIGEKIPYVRMFELIKID
ncbi:MAG: hypothetical protein HWE30_03995 [Methylocystaceae bacterium]|nr:hypothetical protein [Methylocystaceae bacterium]